jgi:predicted ATP-dependent endonuclease of OLD family
MFLIKSVHIEGFWGKYSVSTDLFSEVNIFIGKNGTGKTTFMNLLQAVLQVDLPALSLTEFTSVVIKLKDKSKTATIKVLRENNPNVPFENIIYRVGTKSFQLRIFGTDLSYKRPLIQQRQYLQQTQQLKIEIQNLVRIASLSVHRADYDLSELDSFQIRQMLSKSSIDQRLDHLMQELTRYQLSLEVQARKESSIFEKDVLVSMLYDKQFDKWDLEDISNVELSKEKQELSKAYKELGVLDEIVSKKIAAHIKALSASIKRLKNEDGGINVEDIFPLSLLRRTQYIVNLTKNTEEKKQEIFRPIFGYLNTILGFIEDKKFGFNSSGELEITKDAKPISIAQLSSGEKQLLILLTETLLQKNESFIFLADEPEISLHIEWQAMIVESIRKLNDSAQIIVATHSPEIAAGWKKGIIDMEDIFNG